MPELIDHTLRDRWSADGHALPGHVLVALRRRWGTSSGSPFGAASPVPASDATGTLPAAEVTPSDAAGPVPSPEAAGTLPATARAALAAVVGEQHVHTGHAARSGRAGGLSYLDLLRRQPGAANPPNLPDAVVTPADPEQVQTVLMVCRQHDIAVIPFGGGTSVVGGVEALRGGKPAVIALDLCRLDRLVRVDATSRVAVLQAGVRGPDAERLLAAHGLTLGHLPQSFERATIGGFAATRSAGQASCGYGRFEDMVQGVRLATPAGEWRLGRAPASAAGPDLKRLALGSEGAFGVITEVTVRVRPLPTHRRYEAVVLDGWLRGLRAVRALAQRRVLADVTRLSDASETDLVLALAGARTAALVRRYLTARRVAEPCLLVLGWEATSRRELEARRRASRRALRPFRPVSLGRRAGEAWRRGRFAGPRQRDALLAAGVCVETLETATYWSTVAELAEAVGAALAGALPAVVVGCHLSHAYETGASLYFTVLAPRDQHDPVGQWRRAKGAASDAIARLDATITHHHAVGVEHLPWLRAEIGDLGADVLRAVKGVLDPTGILNPEKLLS